MGLRERIIEGAGGVTEDRLQEITKRQENIWASRIDEMKQEFNEQLNRAYEQGYYDGNDDPSSGDIAKGGFGYKRYADRYTREGKVDYTRAVETAWTLWQKSPLAKRVLAIKRDHIIGHNAQPTTDDKDAVEILNEFWMGNKLDKRSSDFTMQLFGFGDQCYPAFVRESDGRVRLGYIDPGKIHAVVKHPENALEDWAIVTGTSHADRRVYRIIRKDEDALGVGSEIIPAQNPDKLVTWEQAAIEPWELEMLREYGRMSEDDDEQPEYDGSCFYTKVNAVSNQSRGMSDLLQVADWIDQGDEVLFSLADREGFAGYFAFDVTLHGADEKKIKERSNYYRQNPPQKGSINAHNESEEWNMWAPELGQTGTIETFRAILGLILGGMGFPVHWYGFGDDANRATAVAQGDPTAKSLEHEQGIVKDMFLQMCQFALDQAEIAGTYSPPESEEEQAELLLTLPEVTVKDMSRITASMGALAQALTNARMEGWITQETAAKTWAKMMAELDIDIEPATELEAVAAEERQRQLDREQQQNDGLQQAMNGNGQEPQPEMNGQGQGE